jgi:MFS family permease
MRKQTNRRIGISIATLISPLTISGAFLAGVWRAVPFKPVAVLAVVCAIVALPVVIPMSIRKTRRTEKARRRLDAMMSATDPASVAAALKVRSDMESKGSQHRGN